MKHICSRLEGIKAHVRKLRGDKKAVTALEYGLIGAVVVGTVVLGFGTLATSLSGKFVDIGSSL